MSNQPDFLRFVVERALTRAAVQSIMIKAAIRTGVSWWEVKTLPAEYMVSVCGFVWPYEIHGAKVEVFVNTLSNRPGDSYTAFNVPPVGVMQPWALAHAIQKQILLDVHAITVAEPWPESLEQCSTQKLTKGGVFGGLKNWWSNTVHKKRRPNC